MGKEKCSIYCRWQARSPGGECSKGMNSSKAFRERFFFFKRKVYKEGEGGELWDVWSVCGYSSDSG